MQQSMPWTANAFVETKADLIPALNHLVSVCRDGELGFRTAAEDVKSPAVKSLLASFAAQRAGFVRELQEAVRKLGGVPEVDGSLTGLMHREWIDLKSVFTERHMTQILDECATGESYALSAYGNAIARARDADVQSMLKRHYDAIVNASESVRALASLRRSA